MGGDIDVETEAWLIRRVPEKKPPSFFVSGSAAVGGEGAETEAEGEPLELRSVADRYVARRLYVLDCL